MQILRPTTLLSAQRRQQGHIHHASSRCSVEERRSVDDQTGRCVPTNGGQSAGQEGDGHQAHEEHGQIQFGDCFDDRRGGRRNRSGKLHL